MASNPSQSEEIIPNFRQAAKLPKIYRSGAPDTAADSIIVRLRETKDLPLSDAEQFFLHDVDFWIDLRDWDGETNQERCTRIMDEAPGGAFVRLPLDDIPALEQFMTTTSTDDTKGRHRFYMNFEQAMLAESMRRFVVANNLPGLEDTKPATTEQERRTSERRRRTSIFKELGERRDGLVGLNGMILQTHEMILGVLKAITISLEQRRDGKVLIHCSLGKDRTGMIIMLCQALTGVEDGVIIDDYAKSDSYKEVAMEKFSKHVVQGEDVDMSIFCRAEPIAMEKTLELIRNENGSIEGY
jgi:hypothetical protein